METLRELNGVLEASKNKSSGWSTTVDIVRDVLPVYAEKTVTWAVSGNDVDLSKAREEKMTAFFSVTEGSLKKYDLLMNLSSLRRSGSIPRFFRSRVGIVPAVAAVQIPVDLVDGRADHYRPHRNLGNRAGTDPWRRLAVFFILPGKDQIRATYGEETVNGIMKSIHNEIVFAPGDIKLTEEYSKRLGNTTVRVQKQSFNKRDMNNRGQTDSYSEQPPLLMLPQDVNELSYDKQLIFVQGTKNGAH